MKLNLASPEPADARQARTRENLAHALLRLLPGRDFDELTIREIAGEAKIGYATFFRHYPSKQALLHDIAAREIDGLIACALPMLNAQNRRGSSHAVFDYVDGRRPLWSALLTGGAAGMLKEELAERARDLAEATALGGWLPDSLRVAFSVAATVELIAWWLEEGGEKSVDQMAEIHNRLVIAPSVAK